MSPDEAPSRVVSGTEPVGARLDTWLTFLKSYRSIAALAVAYVTGFLVVNAHLAEFGVSDLDFVSARYFLAAANFAFFFVCFYLFAGRAIFQMPAWLSAEYEKIRGSSP